MHMIPTYFTACLAVILWVSNPDIAFRPAKQVSAARTPMSQRKLSFAPTRPVVADADLGPRQPEINTMEGSAAPETTDHRADAGTPASNEQGYDAGRMGVDDEVEERVEQPQAQPATQDDVAPSPPRAAPVPEASASARPTPAAPSQLTPETPAPAAGTPAAPTPTAVPVLSPARNAPPAQGTPSAQQSPAAGQAQKRAAALSPPPQQRLKRSRTAAAAAGAGTGTGTSTNTSTGTSMVVHTAQAAINAAHTFRLGTVRARTSGGENLDSMQAEWVTPWNDADVDMDVPNANPLGGVNLGQKTVRTQNAINELCKTWNDQMATTKVFLLPT